MVEINTQACTGCGACVKDCVGGVLSLAEGHAVHTGRCILCGHCVAICPVQAVAIPEYDMSDLEACSPQDPCPEPGQLLHTIKARRSIRHFQPRPIERDKLALLVEAGRYTATAVNRQDCRFLIVQEQLEEFKELVWAGIGRALEHCGDNPALRPYQNFYANRQRNPAEDFLFRNAPAVLFIANNQALDAGLAAQNIELMAVAQGLGALYNGYLARAAALEPQTLEWLGAGDKKLSACMLLGYPDVAYHRTAPRRQADVVYR